MATQRTPAAAAPVAVLCGTRTARRLPAEAAWEQGNLAAAAGGEEHEGLEMEGEDQEDLMALDLGCPTTCEMGSPSTTEAQAAPATMPTAQDLFMAEDLDSPAPLPWLEKFLLQRQPRHRSRFQASRYFFDSTAAAGGFDPSAGLSSDGHPARWLSWAACPLCLALDHQMHSCPRLRCPVCFEAGHWPHQCSGGSETHLLLQQRLALLLEDAEAFLSSDGLALRCIVCEGRGTGHLNCAALPETGGFTEPPPCWDEHSRPTKRLRRSQEQWVEGAEDGEEADFYHLEEVDVGRRYSAWSSPDLEGEEAKEGEGEEQAVDAEVGLEAAILQLVGEGPGGCPERCRAALEAAAPEAIAGASRRLGRAEAVARAPGGGALQLTDLGRWLAELPLVPPAFALALFHGALWGVLLPVAVLVVILEVLPPGDDEAKESAVASLPQNSGHYGLVATYFRWREGRRDTGLQPTAPWELLHQRIVALLKHAQQALGYDGDDAAFEEMDGELMSVRRPDGRPWTLASALGSEDDSRWQRFGAALAAAFPPARGPKAGEWVVQTPTLTGTAHAPVETRVSPGHAALFGGEEGLDLLRGPPNEADLEELQALRQDLAERRAEALEALGAAADGGSGLRLAVMDEELVDRVLAFLSSSEGELELVEPGDRSEVSLGTAADSVEAGVLSLLGLEAPSSGLGGEQEGKVAHPSLEEPGVAGPTEAREKGHICLVLDKEEEDPVSTEASEAGLLDTWAALLLRSALLRALKGRAVEAEDFDQAGRLKAAEAPLARALAAARRAALEAAEERRLRGFAGLGGRRRRAVEEEDYEAALELKREEAELLAGRVALPEELERLAEQKKRAVAEEDYGRAAELREQLAELEARHGLLERATHLRAAALAASGLAEQRDCVLDPAEVRWV